MRIEKIRINDDKAAIEWSELSKTKKDKWNAHNLTSPDEPLPEFFDALQELAPDICKICEEDEERAELLTVKGLTLSYDKKNQEKVTFVATIPVKMSNSPKNITSPNVSLNVTEESEYFQFIQDLKEKLDTIKGHAKNYINGMRKDPDQTSMEFEKKESEKVETEKAA